MPATEFVETYRDEHRQLRDALLGLIEAFEGIDTERAREAIEEMATIAAPHFHYEQEAIYPALAELHGDEYVEKLIEEHARAVAAAQQLAELAAQEELDEEAAAYGLELVRQLLPHVSDRDGLAVMVEVMEPAAIKKIHRAQKESKTKGATLAGLKKRMAKTTAKVKTARKPVPKRTAKATRATSAKARTTPATAAVKRRRK
jgi:hypothetical protein